MEANKENKDIYRVPTIDEFVQGFKFQVKKTGSFGIMDFSDTKVRIENEEPYEMWVDAVVNWKHPEHERYVINHRGLTINANGHLLNLMNKPFDVASYLEQGLIRCKIDKTN